MRPVACGPRGPLPAPMPRSRSSPGSDARHWSPHVILGFAEYARFFLIYICLSFSLLFRQSLLYNSHFNISIRTRLISTSSKYVVGVKATARLFVASKSRGHTSLPWLRWWCAVHKYWTFCCAIRYFQSRMKHKISSTRGKSQSKKPSSQYTRRCMRGY
jgi:hypothetical protein